MPHGSQYRHYFRRIDVDADSYNWEDIEDRFSGLIYMSASGINDIGRAKNIYTEGYADSDRMRVYVPEDDDDYANESTQIEMKFLVVGDALTRNSLIVEFTDYIRHGVHSYYDTARYREFDFVVTNEIVVSDERWHGSTPYVEITVPMTNLNGSTKDVSPQYSNPQEI